MKRILNILSAVALILCASCQEQFQISSGTKGSVDFGKFSITREDIDVQIETKSDAMQTKAAQEATGDYIVEILTSEDESVWLGTYSQVKATGYGVELLAGKYYLKVLSGQIPNSAFETPVYGAREDFTIVAGEKTFLDPVTCKLQQCAVTVSYSQELLDLMTGDGKAKVEVMSGYPLEYALTCSGGNVSYDQRIGYFAVPSAPSTMIVTFSGRIEGKNQTMSKYLSNINVCELHKILFIKKESPQGNVTFDIVVDSYVQDEELSSALQASLLDPIGDDPDAPKGDGGIKLEFAEDCTQFTDLQNIVVTPSGQPFDLRLVATVPNGVKKFKVDIASTNKGFEDAVAAAGGPIIDLVNPSAESEIIFQVVPFPHGPELLGQTEVNFNLSSAQEPILLFPGEHSFKMMVTDEEGCHNEITIKMIVQ